MAVDDDFNDGGTDVERAYAEFREAWHNGEKPDPDTFCSKHDACGPALRELIDHFLFVSEEFFAAPLDVAPEDDRDGLLEMVLGDFKILREIGRGGMGVVYEAEQISLGRKVALKVLPAHLSFSDDTVKKFRREAKAGGRQHHSGIVSIHAVGEEQGIHYIAQELISGGKTLADHLESLRKSGDLPVGYFRETAKMAAAIAEALHHAHETGVIHRDVKPSNILLTDSGSPMVTDFGLAKVEDALALSRTGDFAGTPYYMSPEQAAGRREKVDHRTDIFSFGVTLYEMMTLVRPFEGDTTQEVLRKIVAEDPKDPRKVSHRVPRDLAVICLKAVEKKPDHRYTDMGALAEDLKRFVYGEPILAQPASTMTKLVKRIKRNPTVSGAIGVALLALISLIIMVPLYIVSLNKEKRKAEALHLAARSDNVLAKNPGLALLLGIKSLETYPYAMGNEALYGAISSIREIKTIVTGSVFSAVFSPDGKRFITASPEGIVKIWDSRNGALLAELIPHGSSCSVQYAVFSPDGMRAAAALSDGIVLLWDISDLSKPVQFLSLEGHENKVNHIAFSPDGSRIASASDDMTIRIWDAWTGEEQAMLAGHAWAVRTVSFSPDGKRVVSALEDATARIWDLETGKQTGDILHHNHVVTCAKYDPSGEKIVTCSEDKTARIWDLQTGECLLLKHDKIVTSVCFDSNGLKVITASTDGAAYLWDAESGERLASFNGHEDAVLSACFDPQVSNRVLTAAGDGTVRLWNATVKTRDLELFKAVISPNGRHVVHVHDDRKKLDLWQMEPWKLVNWLPVDDEVKNVHFSPDGNKLLIILEKNTHLLWRCVGDGKAEKIKIPGDLSEVAFSPDSRFMIITDTKRMAFSWDIDNLTELDIYESEEKIIGLDFDAPSKRMVAVSEDGTVYYGKTDYKKLKLPSSFMKEGKFRSAYLCDDSRTIFTLSDSDELALLDTHTKESRTLEYGNIPIKEISIGKKSNRVLIIPNDCPPIILDLTEGRIVSEISGYDGAIELGRLRSDGGHAIFVSTKRKLLVWDVVKDQVQAQIDHKDEIVSIEYSDDGQYFFSATETGQVYSWPVSPISHAKAIAPRSLSSKEKKLYKIESDDPAPIDDADMVVSNRDKKETNRYQRSVAENDDAGHSNQEDKIISNPILHHARDPVSMLILAKNDTDYQLWYYHGMDGEKACKIYDYGEDQISDLVMHRDRDQLAFLTKENENTTVIMKQVIGLDRQTVVAETPVKYREFSDVIVKDLCWHPIKKLLYFCTKSHERKNYRDRISMIDLNENNIQILLDRPMQMFGYPAVSPDGTQIAFIHYPNNSSGYEMTLWVGRLSEDGKSVWSPEQMTENEYSDMDPLFNEDGTIIYWISKLSKRGEYRLFQLDRNKNGDKPIIDPGNLNESTINDYSLSRDGRIGFTTLDQNSIFIVDAHKGDLLQSISIPDCRIISFAFLN